MKNQTPMHQLKDHFKNFEANVVHLQKSKKLGLPINLGKSSTVGIKSDFVRIYEDLTKIVSSESRVFEEMYGEVAINKYNSFAFVFNYINLDIPTISFSTHVDGNYTSSQSYAVDEFKALMKVVNKTLKTCPILSPLALREFLTETFIGENPLVVEDEIKKAVKEVVDTNKELLGEIQTLTHMVNALNYHSKFKEKVVKEEIEASKAFSEYERLKKELELAESNLNSLTENVRLKYNMNLRYVELQEFSNDLRTSTNAFDKNTSKILKKYPVNIRNTANVQLDTLLKSSVLR
jgi:hypothetical protein